MITLKKMILVFLALLLASCNYPLRAGFNSTPVAVSSSNPLVQVPANATATATPFQPDSPTPTYLPTDYPNLKPPSTSKPGLTPTPSNPWGDYKGPTVWPDVEIPTPVELFEQPNGQINIMLIGSDQRPDTYGFRTDTLLLATINPKDGSVNITSFPRDLYVYIPGWTMQRINTAFPHGSFELLAETMEYNFGFRPDYYVLINFWSFKQVVDSLGGINVQVGRTHTDHRDGHGDYTVYAGTVHMDGETALWYARSRYSTSDFDRGRRQQEVIQAIFFKLLSLNAVQRAPELYDIYKRNVTTNITLDVITTLLPMAAKVSDGSKINNYFISSKDVTNYRTSQGAAVLLPIRDAVLDVMRQALNIP